MDEKFTKATIKSQGRCINMQTLTEIRFVDADESRDLPERIELVRTVGFQETVVATVSDREELMPIAYEWSPEFGAYVDSRLRANDRNPKRWDLLKSRTLPLGGKDVLFEVRERLGVYAIFVDGRRLSMGRSGYGDHPQFAELEKAVVYYHAIADAQERGEATPSPEEVFGE